MKKLSERKKKWIERTIANDRSYKVFLYNRFFVFLLAVLAQIAGYGTLAVLLVYNSAYAIILQLAVFILEMVFVLSIINCNQRPSTRLNWIILILIAPVFGVPMYLVNGHGRPTRAMHKKIQGAKEQNAKRLATPNCVAFSAATPNCAAFSAATPNCDTFSAATPNCANVQKACASKIVKGAAWRREDAITRYISVYAGYPVFTEGEVVYYPSGEACFPHMLEALKGAKKYILLEYFIIAHGYMWNEISKILLEKAMQGVRIRIIYDDFGCMMTLPPRYDAYLESLHENIKCMSFNQVVPVFAVRMNNRDHRKMLVVDGDVAFTGGINLADEYVAKKRRFGYWKDTCIQVRGSAVRSFVQMFFYLWNAFRKDKEDVNAYAPPCCKQKSLQQTPLRIQPYDDSPLDDVSVGESVYIDLIDRARKYVYIFTPYLVLDDFMRTALCRAAMRGVDVRLVTPGIPDKKMVFRLTRANYAILLKAGVRIYEYTPGFLHAKSMVCDDESAVVGTINLDYRSLYHHFENAVYFSGCEAVLAVKRDCEETFALSKERTLQNTKRGVIGRLTDAVLRVFEALL